MTIFPQFLSAEFDDQFRKIDGLHYLPWVGTNFSSSDHAKILFVAESVYNWDSSNPEVHPIVSDPSFARTVISEHGFYHYIENPWNAIINSKLARNLERLIIGRPHVTLEEREKIWAMVSFHEFVQRPLDSNGPQHRPNSDDFALGAKVLLDIIPIIAPGIVIFLGTDNSKISHYHENNLIEVTYHDKIGRYQPKSFNLLNTPVVMIRHPSKFFSWSKWHDFLAVRCPQPLPSFKT